MLTTSPSLDRTKQKRMPVCVTSTCVISICATSSCVMSVCVSVCVCGVNLCDVNLCDVNLCDVNLCDVKRCDVNLCDVNLCDVKLCDVNLCDVNLCGVNLCDVKLCDVNLCDFNLCNADLCAQLPRTQFNYTQQGAKPACQQDIHTKFFAAPIGTATPNAIYTQQGTKPACQQDIHTKFSHLLLAQLPRTQFIHSKPPNPHARKTSTQNFRSSYWHSYPERNLHTARRQNRMPAGHQRKFSHLLLAQLPRTQFTQSKPECQQDINAKFSHLLLAQLPQTQFTHSKPPNPHARKTSTRKRTSVHCIWPPVLEEVTPWFF